MRGVLLSLAAAVAHSAVDVTRKTASQQAALNPTVLVCLVALLDALLSCTAVAVTGGFNDVHFRHRDVRIFISVVAATSALLLLAKYMYQSALAMSQLSLTVPYLSFTPTFLVVTAYLFLGEAPTPFGLLGVATVSAGGFLLARLAATPSSSSGSSNGGAGGMAGAGPNTVDWKAGGVSKPGQLVIAVGRPDLKHAKSATPVGNVTPVSARPDGQGNRMLGTPRFGDSVLVPLTGPRTPQPPLPATVLMRGRHSLVGGSVQDLPVLEAAAAAAPGRSGLYPDYSPYGDGRHSPISRGQQHEVISLLPAASINNKVAVRTVFRSVAAASQVDVPELPQAHHHHHLLQHHQVAVNGMGGAHGSAGSDGHGAAPHKLGGGLGGTGGIAGNGRHASSPSKPGNAGGVRGRGSLHRWLPVKMSAPTSLSGATLVLLVALTWSVTASLDKLGVLHAPSVWVYMCAQRVAIAVVATLYLALHYPRAFHLLGTRHLRILCLISIAELLSVVFFLEAIRFLFVSYVVALKRLNIVVSVLVGGLVFRERIAKRLPFVGLMLAGVALIAVDPSGSSVHLSSGHAQ